MVCTSGLLSDQAEQGLGLDASLLPHSMDRAGRIGVLDGGFDSWDWPSALPWDAAALPGFALSSSLELRACRWYPPCLAGFIL